MSILEQKLCPLGSNGLRQTFPAKLGTSQNHTSSFPNSVERTLDTLTILTGTFFFLMVRNIPSWYRVSFDQPPQKLHMLFIKLLHPRDSRVKTALYSLPSLDSRLFLA